MKVITTTQLSKLDIKKIDIGIFSAGYEKRCTHIATTIDKTAQFEVKLCLSFINQDSETKLNKKIFTQLGFDIKGGNGNDGRWVENLLIDYFKKLDILTEEITVFIDYSSMTRVWYASILRFFYYSPLKFKNIRLIFAYSFAQFSNPPITTVRNIHVEPLDGYSSFSLPDKPTALILGLGYEPEKAYGLTEFFDAETYLFYNDASLSAKFSKAVEETNKYLLNLVPKENIYLYPIGDMIFTEKLLSNLCRALGESNRIVIAPTGPKPFTLISLITSLKFDDVDVWRISPGNDAKITNREASGTVSYLQVMIG
ncbi:hypothetical protein A0256_19615 [Mucilaginibacter sp. PAMC 26640]|nr:hypothetical protein A0256_19615 [Mucilaginibacter sp. PAMC 26640]